MDNIAPIIIGAGPISRCSVVLRILTFLVCMATLLPFFRADEWWVRIWDFPRIQLAILAVLILILFFFQRTNSLDRYFMLATLLALIVQLVQIFPYTPLAKKQVVSDGSPGTEVRVFAFNVLQSNRKVEPLLALIKQWNPDLILLTETDSWWAEQTQLLKKHYPHFVSEPLTNTYGVLLYSRLPLMTPEIRYLVQRDVPSVRAQVKLANGQTFYFYGVHPKPPGVPSPRGEVPDSTPRDAELIVIAKEAKQLQAPVIVAGDFNDVAWSHTTRLFQRTSRLLDPRRGRGLYNTFHARQPLFRFPVDHVFHSEHFTLIQMERLPEIGSDHFPIFIALKLSPAAAEKQEPPSPKPTDQPETEEILKKADEQK